MINTRGRRSGRRRRRDRRVFDVINAVQGEIRKSVSRRMECSGSNWLAQAGFGQLLQEATIYVQLGSTVFDPLYTQ